MKYYHIELESLVEALIIVQETTNSLFKYDDFSLIDFNVNHLFYSQYHFSYDTQELYSFIYELGICKNNNKKKENERNPFPSWKNFTQQ